MKDKTLNRSAKLIVGVFIVVVVSILVYVVYNAIVGYIQEQEFLALQQEIWLQSTYPFTGKIVCGQCGKNYQRKIANAGKPYEKAMWICSTYKKRGKAACPSQQIPEDVLLEIDYDFEKIRVPKPYTLMIIKPDGSEIGKRWKHKPRSKKRRKNV